MATTTHRGARPARGGRWPRRLTRAFRYDLIGAAFAVVFLCCSLTPSLLPRGWLLQGLIGGVSAAIGYGVGVFGGWLVNGLAGRDLRPAPGRRGWAAFGAAAAAAVALFLVLGAGWQRDLHALMGLAPPARASYLAVLLVAATTFALLVGAGRALRRAARWLGRWLGRWIPAPAAGRIAAVLVVLLAVGLLNGVLIDGFFAVADSAFKTANGETDPDLAPPTGPERSGGAGSLVAWESLGNEGRTFVAGGPTVAQLADFGGGTARPPIRVYTGLESAPDAAAQAALAVRELERTGAFSRKLLCVVTPTGSGWVDAAAVDPLEYMYAGDTALVATQYSYLPSWISFLVDKERARRAGRELFNQVYAAWAARPVGQRPRLVVFGESLGSFGAESAFGGSADMSQRTDGILLVGPPNRNALWREFVSGREPGTPEILPTYGGGGIVRFGARPDDLDRPAGGWGPTRVGYLQHPSDPIVWWAPRLLVDRPDWLAEPRGADISPRMRWYPFVTFWQVSADLAFATGVPAGHGHDYGTEPVAAWARIAPPDGWTPQRTAALTALMDQRQG